MLDIVTMVFESTSMRYETLVARFWLRVRRVPQSSCRRQSRDKRQELWGRECVEHMGILSAHARKESNFMNSAPFVILNALPAGF